MASDPEHPIATPKGASAVSVLLAVVGVFSPFLFDLRAALTFAGISILVIVWLYGKELVGAVTGRGWAVALNVPLLSVAAIIAMGMISVTAKRPAPPLTPAAPPALTADDVTNAIERWATRNQAPAAQQTASPPPRSRIIQMTPELVPPPQTPPPTPPRDEEFAARMDAIIQRSREQSSKLKELSACSTKAMRVSVGMSRLTSQAANYQNGWAYHRNAERLLDEYKS